MRSEEIVKAVAEEARAAAVRHASSADQGDWRRSSLKTLFEMLERRVGEYDQAVLRGDPELIKKRCGDVVWVATMIADHDGVLLTREAAG